MKFICFLGHFSYNLMWSDKGRDTVDEACKEKKEEVINCLVKRKWLSKCFFWIRVIFLPFWRHPKFVFQSLFSAAFVRSLRYFAQDWYFQQKIVFFLGSRQLKGCNPELAHLYNLERICKHPAIQDNASHL